MEAAKEMEIAAGQTQIDAKTQQLADTGERNAQAKESITDTRASLSAIKRCLVLLKKKCQATIKSEKNI